LRGNRRAVGTAVVAVIIVVLLIVTGGIAYYGIAQQ
jgi:hypothetical protein